MGKLNDWFNKIEGKVGNWLDDHPFLDAITKPWQALYNVIDTPHDALVDVLDGVKGAIGMSDNSMTNPTLPIGGNGSQSVQSSTGSYADALSNVENIIQGQVDTAGGAVNDILGISHAVGLNNQYDLAKWQLENAYNSPLEQMKRFKDAGLNPNLIYGNGSASAGNAGTIGSSHIDPALASSQSLQLLSGASQVGRTMSEISNIEANTEKQKKESDVLTYTIQKERQSVINMVGEYDKLRAEINKIKSDTRLNHLESIYKEYINGTLDLDLMQRKYNLSETEIRILQMRANIEKTQQETKGLVDRLNMDIWTFNNVDRLNAVIKQNEVEISNMDRILKEIYGEKDAATSGMTGLVGNVARGLGSVVGEIKYMSKKRREKRNNN